MVYNLKVNKGDWVEFKNNRDWIPINKRLNVWIEFFAENGFSGYEDFFKIGSSAKMLKVDFDDKEISKFNLTVDDELWRKFKNRCRDNGMSANYALGCMINMFNKNGGFIDITVRF